jgi:formylglycine-generating enzyme required for sulfatase activity
MPNATALVLLLAAITAGCLTVPHFSATEEADLHEDMVLIHGPKAATPAATASAPPTLRALDGKGGNDAKGGNDGKGKPDAGPPTPTPTPAPTPAPTATTSPSPSSPSPSASSATAAPTQGGSSNDFWIDAHETSAAEYASCVGAGRCSAAACAADGADHPVVCVSRAAAAAYCAFKGKRLPTAAEWTLAAAGAASRRFPWGDAPPDPDRLDACGAECRPNGMFAGNDGYARTAPVGSYPLGATVDGVFDLAGNVAEWVDATTAVVRGGSFTDVDPNGVATSAARTVADALPSADVGFRCASSD